MSIGRWDGRFDRFEGFGASVLGRTSVLGITKFLTFGGYDQFAVERFFGLVPRCPGLDDSLQASTIDCGEADTDPTKRAR